MIFTSYTYLLLLVAAFALHWLSPAKMRTAILVVVSYVFYCSWKWEYGLLLLGVSLFTYYYAAFLAKRGAPAGLLAIGIAVELLPLIFFKYTNFLLENAQAVAGVAGAAWKAPALHIILPLGVSFFTFQGIAYLVDVAAGDEPFKKLSHFVLFKAFWPQLIAGPIIRPGEIREQIEGERALTYEDVAFGTRRIVSGMAKKVVLADTLAPYVDSVFSSTAAPAFLDSVVGVVGFGMQVYFDFSGYSDIAIGSARLMGFKFPENFQMPYMARSPQEFWNRWHMTLSRWIRDYVFTPLTFASRSRPRLALLWLVVAMALCGLWHGARWTFVIWGIWHGVLLALNQTRVRRWLAATDQGGAARWRVRGVVAWAATLALTMGSWAFFRAQSVGQAGRILASIVTFEGRLRPAIVRENGVLVVALMFTGLLLVQSVMPAIQRAAKAISERPLLDGPVRGVYYCALVTLTIAFDSDAKAFVYFQF